MELALVVYLVATLGAIKGFVSAWWWVFFVVFTVTYVVVKLKLVQFKQNRKELHLSSPKWCDVSESKKYTLTSPLGPFGVGEEVYFNKFDTYGYVSKRQLGTDNRIKPEDGEFAVKQTPVFTTQETITPLDVNIGKLKYVAVTLLCLHLFLPTEKTLQYAAGAYLIQTTYESEFVQEAGSLAGKAVTNQLRKWAESNPDIDTLLESVEATKQKAESVAK